jgi:3-methyladenine DNA glycosylase AlkD
MKLPRKIPSAVPSLTVDRMAGGIVGELHALADPVRAQGVQNYFKHNVVALGIDTPTLRRYTRERVIRAIQAGWTLPDGIGLCDRLLGEPELEIRGAGILILAAFHQEFDRRLIKPAERWLGTRLDNWALVDAFASSVISPLLAKWPSVETILRRWSRDRVFWRRRAALVTLVPFARHGHRLDLAYELAREHFSAKEDLMHKATGWLLREAGKTDRQRLRDFLMEHGPAIPRTTLRYAIEKFPGPERRKLLAATRGASD